MFQREIEGAVRCGDRMLEQFDAAYQAANIRDVTPQLEAALESAWRMETLLGEFLALGEPKIIATGNEETFRRAERAFLTLRPALREADRGHRLPEAQMKEWMASARETLGDAVALAQQAWEVMPKGGSHRITAPAGEAPAGQGVATVSMARTTERVLRVEDVERLIREALRPLGGIEAFVKPGQTVLLKPNQTLWILAWEGSTTDPRVVAATVKLCREAGAARVIVGESSGGGSKTLDVMEVTGVGPMATSAGAELCDFQTSAQREVEVPNGVAITRALVPVPLLEADVVIGLPKLKTHNWDWISGALKLWVGCVDPTWRSAHHDKDTYEEYLDLHTVAPAQLWIMDALVRGVGNGPGANHGQFYGGILAATDPTAMDTVAAQIQGFDPAAIGFVQAARAHGFGVGDPDRISVVGVPLRDAVEPAIPPVEGVDIYDANIICGTGLTRAGTLGHFKSLGDVLMELGVWTLVRRLHGKATVLIGDADDPMFTKHLAEGPYVVIDDAAPERYKDHPRVYFIPGHPVLHNLQPEMLKGLGLGVIGPLGFLMMKDLRLVAARLELYSPLPLMPLVHWSFLRYQRLPALPRILIGGAVMISVEVGKRLRAVG